MIISAKLFLILTTGFRGEDFLNFSHRYTMETGHVHWLWLVGFVALRPKSTSMVIAGRSVHLTTLFPGQT